MGNPPLCTVFSQAIVKDIEELRRIAFEIEGDPNMNAVHRSPSAPRDFKKLGFQVITLWTACVSLLGVCGCVCGGGGE